MSKLRKSANLAFAILSTVFLASALFLTIHLTLLHMHLPAIGTGIATCGFAISSVRFLRHVIYGKNTKVS